jgi:hypothetical protein
MLDSWYDVIVDKGAYTSVVPGVTKPESGGTADVRKI